MDEFKEALKKLGIEEYGERIFNSSSRGELSHLGGYIALANMIKDDRAEDFRKWFVKQFEMLITYAENNWNRPESVFQHIPELILGGM